MIDLPKFRAYDVQWDTMYYSHEHEGSPFECRVNLYRGEWEIDLCDVDENKIGTAGIDGKKYILMQYSRIKDKTGKEICEGDICEVRFNDPSMNKTGIVEYVNLHTHFTIKMPDGGSTSLSVGGSVVDGVYVLGNIYENPELNPNG